MYDKKNGFAHKTNLWEFYIHDVEDSIFEAESIFIYDSTFECHLRPRKSFRIRHSIVRTDSKSKNEVHLFIKRECTRKNPKIYLKSDEIIDLKSYTTHENIKDEPRDNIDQAAISILAVILLIPVFAVVIFFLSLL